MFHNRGWVTLPGDGPNEDRCGCEGSLAWVIDGATPLSDERIAPSSPTDAVWIADVLDSEIRRRSGSRLPLDHLLAEAIAEVVEAAERDWIHHPTVPPSAAVGLIRDGDGSTTEYLVLADVSIAMDGRTGIHVVADNRADKGNVAASQELKALLDAGASHREAMDEVKPLLLQYRRTRMNTDGGYWVAALDPQAAFHAVGGHIEDLKSALLTSDGFSRGAELFGLWTWDLPLHHPQDLQRLAAEIRDAERRDPQCSSFPRWNVSDDLIALAVESVNG